MSKSYLAVIVMSLFFFNSSAMGILKTFQVKLENKCSPTILKKGFLLKKSLIEIIQNEEDACGMPFTKRVLKDCPSLSCVEYQEFYTEYKNNQDGKVIGR